MGKVIIGLFAAMSLSLTTLAGCAADTSDGSVDESVGESEDHLLTGRRLSQKEAASVLRTAGFPESSIGKMVCTIKYESNFYERATNKNHNGTVDYGLLQVNSIHFGRAGCPSSSAGLFDAATNAKCALAIYKSQGINAWYGYQKHRSECDRYPAPAGSASSSSGSSDDSSDGGCYSGTLKEMVDAKTCVESKFDNTWYQCKAGNWLRGGQSGTGPAGACASKHPL